MNEHSREVYHSYNWDIDSVYNVDKNGKTVIENIKQE